MATKRHHNGKWEYCIKRKALLRRPIYLRFADEAEGDAYVHRVELLLDQGVIPTEIAEQADEVTTLYGLIVQWQRTRSLARADEAMIPALLQRVGNTRIAAVTRLWAEKWIEGMKSEGLAPSTIRHHVGTLARCIDWCVSRDSALLPANPLRTLPRRYATGHGRADEERDRRLTDDEEVRIRRVLSGEKPDDRQRPFAADPDMLRLFDLALETAMRMREMYTLDIAQVDIKKRTVFLDKTKNGDKRQVPLSSVAITVLKKQIGKRKSGALFPWWSGSPKDLARTTSRLSSQFARIFDAAGCVGLRFHDLRHESTSRLFERTTLSDLQIAKITGHRDPKMLMRYSNLRGSDLAERLW